MSYSTVYADTLTPYTNSQAIAGRIQEKVDNADQNDLIFAKVDYSKGYDTLLDGFESSSTNGTNGTNGTDGTSGTSGSDGSNGANGSSGTATDGGTLATSADIEALRAEFKNVQDEQGWVGKAWNGIKNFFGSKNGSNAIEKTIEQAEKGEISLEAAQEKLNKYRTKQKSTVNTFANIASGLAVAIGVIGAPFSFGTSLAIGAGVGALVKVGIKGSDAATNNIENDYGAKDILKDGITGGVGGAVTVATAGIGTASVAAGATAREAIKAGVIAGAKAGAIDGAVMGATNYTVEAATEEDVDFTFGGLVSNTATGAVVGGAVGGAVGGVTSGVRYHHANKTAAAATEAGEETVEGAATKATADGAGSAKAPSADEIAAAKAKLEQAQTKAGKAYEEYVDDPVAEAGSELQIAHSKAHEEMLQAQAEYNKLLDSSKAAADSAGEAAEEVVTEETKKSLIQSLKGMFKNSKVPQGLQQLAENAKNLKNMSRQDVWKAVTGKPGATYAEFKTAYNNIFAKASKEINLNDKTNLALRTFFEDLWQVGNSDNI